MLSDEAKIDNFQWKFEIADNGKYLQLIIEIITYNRVYGTT